MQNGRTPTYSHRHAMAGLIRLFLTDRVILNELAIHLKCSVWTYTESPGFKMNPNVVYATSISKITNFSERLKYRTLRKYNFVNSFNVKTDFKRYKVLQGVTCVWKCKIFSKNLSCMLSNPMMNCGTNFLNTLYKVKTIKGQVQNNEGLQSWQGFLLSFRPPVQLFESAQSERPLSRTEYCLLHHVGEVCAIASDDLLCQRLYWNQVKLGLFVDLKLA